MFAQCLLYRVNGVLVASVLSVSFFGPNLACFDQFMLQYGAINMDNIATKVPVSVAKRN